MVAQINANDVYTNLSGLNAIKATGREDASQGLKEVAKQFESLFINMMLKTMRESNKVFSEGNYLSSNEMEIHQQNFDNQMSLHLSAGEGIGLADVLYRQLKQQYEIDPGLEAGAGNEFVVNSPDDFVQSVLPFAEKAARKLGVDPEFLIAQSALETGWGSKVASDSRGGNSYNLFGIKADASWQGPVAKTKTLEFDGAVAKKQTAEFRKYDSVEESFDDYVNFLNTNPRYQKALENVKDSGAFAASLQQAGYATDPRYGEKIKAVINSNAMQNALNRTHRQG